MVCMEKLFRLHAGEVKTPAAGSAGNLFQMLTFATLLGPCALTRSNKV